MLSVLFDVWNGRSGSDCCQPVHHSRRSLKFPEECWVRAPPNPLQKVHRQPHAKASGMRATGILCRHCHQLNQHLNHPQNLP